MEGGSCFQVVSAETCASVVGRIEVESDLRIARDAGWRLAADVEAGEWRALGDTASGSWIISEDIGAYADVSVQFDILGEAS